MNGTTKRRLAVGGAVALAAAGGGAALASRGHHSPAAASVPRTAFVDAGPTVPEHGPHGVFSAVLTYLGLTPAQLRTQLESGKTLAQIADATPGKSAAGLVDAIVDAARQRLAAAVSAGRLTQAQADRISASLRQRITALLNATRPPGPPPFRRAHGRGGAFRVAAAYLGISPQALFADLRAGKTLAQVADATAGKSAAGLVAALVAHERQELADAVAAGRLTQAQADRISTSLQQRVTDLVDGAFPRHDRFRGDVPPPPGANA